MKLNGLEKQRLKRVLELDQRKLPVAHWSNIKELLILVPKRYKVLALKIALQIYEDGEERFAIDNWS